jgi:hypothetical protein
MSSRTSAPAPRWRAPSQRMRPLSGSRPTMGTCRACRPGPSGPIAWCWSRRAASRSAAVRGSPSRRRWGASSRAYPAMRRLVGTWMATRRGRGDDCGRACGSEGWRRYARSLRQWRQLRARLRARHRCEADRPAHADEGGRALPGARRQGGRGAVLLLIRRDTRQRCQPCRGETSWFVRCARPSHGRSYRLAFWLSARPLPITRPSSPGRSRYSRIVRYGTAVISAMRLSLPATSSALNLRPPGRRS